MSIKALTRLSNRQGAGYSAWSRPTDWLALPVLTAGTDKIVALAAVYNQGHNLFALTIAGAYTVDWGDGTAAQNVATGVTATHDYAWSALGSGTVTSEGFRQAIVTVTMQAANTMTSVTFDSTPAGATAGYLVQWRDIAMAGTSVTSLSINSSGSFRNALYWFTYVGGSAITSLTNFCRITTNLKGITGTSWTHSVTSFTTAFNGCSTLESVPLFDTAACTNFSSMFQNCTRLRTVPLFVTSVATTMNSMFSGCANLQSIPLFDTSNVTDTGLMFATCVSLTTIPLFVTSKVTNISSMFSGCTTLSSVPALDTTLTTSMGSMFSNCASLVTLPAAFASTHVTDFSSMFSGCTSLVAHPSMTFSAGINFNSMFSSCTSLGVVNLTGSSVGTSFTSIVQACTALRSLTIDCTSIPSTAAAIFTTTATNVSTGITTAILTGLKFAPGSATALFTNQQLDATACNNLYTSLGTASGAQTITVTGCPGKAGSTQTIATGKGWTVA